VANPDTCWVVAHVKNITQQALRKRDRVARTIHFLRSVVYSTNVPPKIAAPERPSM
jgi:hypothetical protein